MPLHNNLQVLADAKRYLWTSERSGFAHLYLGRFDQPGLTPLTEGEWMVEEFAGCQWLGAVYFSATRDSALERHAYAVSLAGGEPRRFH